MNNTSFLLLLAFFGSIQAFEWKNGTCPKLETLPRFLPGHSMMMKYSYERKSLNNFLFNDEGKCTTRHNEFEEGVFTSIYEQINEKNETEVAYGVADVDDDPNIGEKKIFNFEFFGEKLQPFQIPAIVVATDSKNYSVTYACKQITDPISDKSKKFESVWVYTSERGDASHDSKIKSDLEPLGLDYDSFKVTDQSNCPNFDSSESTQ